MTLALAILAILVIGFVILTVHRQNQVDRRWRAERERRAAYDERRAAANSHPDGDIVAITPTADPTRRP